MTEYGPRYEVINFECPTTFELPQQYFDNYPQIYKFNSQSQGVSTVKQLQIAESYASYSLLSIGDKLTKTQVTSIENICCKVIEKLKEIKRKGKDPTWSGTEVIEFTTEE